MLCEGGLHTRFDTSPRNELQMGMLYILSQTNASHHLHVRPRSCEVQEREEQAPPLRWLIKFSGCRGDSARRFVNNFVCRGHSRMTRYLSWCEADGFTPHPSTFLRFAKRVDTFSHWRRHI